MKTIGIIALSGACDKDKVLNAKKFFETEGFNVKLSENIFDKDRYLAGSDDKKLKELHKFFSDSEIDIIMCERGGYGAIRLVNRIDYNLIKKNPKIFCGFSDVTALLLMIYKKTGMVVYHGPMAISDFWDEPYPLTSSLKGRENTYTSFLDAIKGEKLQFQGNKIYKDDSAQSIIWGGNLATVVSLCGLYFIPDENFVFFAEDLNEQVYKIDKMFQQLINIDNFRQNCKGIVLGDFLDCGNEEWLQEYFEELANRLEIPIAGGFKITHEREKITVPIGRQAKLAGNKLVIL